MKNTLKDVAVANLKYCSTVFLAGILSNLGQNLLCSWQANLERPKDFLVQKSAEIIRKYF